MFWQVADSSKVKEEYSEESNFVGMYIPKPVMEEKREFLKTSLLTRFVIRYLGSHMHESFG
jgi:hypothetical protein